MVVSLVTILAASFWITIHISNLYPDLQPANILLSVATSMNIETTLDPPTFSDVKWLEKAEINESAPKYLMPSQRRRGTLDDFDVSTLFVKIGDLGGGKSFHPMQFASGHN